MKELKIKDKEEFIKNHLEDSEIDIDYVFCKETDFMFENSEDSTDYIDMLTSEVNAKAFKIVFPDAKIDF